jgi:hypothetical protein
LRNRWPIMGAYMAKRSKAQAKRAKTAKTKKDENRRENFEIQQGEEADQNDPIRNKRDGPLRCTAAGV